MSHLQERRKNEHVAIAKKYYAMERDTGFDDFRFVHHSMPLSKRSDVHLESPLCGYPLYINAMTGGSARTKEINEKLAILARETGLAMAVGSMSVALKTGESDSFTITRQVNPKGKIFANIGANHPADHGQKVVDLLQADALQIHVNAPQEVVMPEGDEDFSMWADHIQTSVDSLDVPVIVKEVGYGMSRETVSFLHQLGVRYIDVGGRGGTDFNQIEDERRVSKYKDLHDWGQTTPVSLLEATSANLNDLTLFASGGVRTALDIVKSLALGASAVGMSAPFLVRILDDGLDESIQWVQNLKEEIQDIFFMVGASSIKDLQQKTQIVVSGASKDWCLARGINIQSLAQR